MFELVPSLVELKQLSRLQSDFTNLSMDILAYVRVVTSHIAPPVVLSARHSLILFIGLGLGLKNGCRVELRIRSNTIKVVS